jgi:glycosyltransferase involved in cell wall biosynthesis
MKILINTSNLRKGGALQVTSSFLEEIRADLDNEYYVVLSKSVSKIIDVNNFSANFYFFNYTIKASVVTSFTGADRFLDKIEADIRPDCVFSVFGPSYWKPTSVHLMGYAIPHYVYPESAFFGLLSFSSSITLYLRKYIHRHSLKRSDAFFWCETDDVKHRLSFFLNISTDRIKTIGNTYHPVFDQSKLKNTHSAFRWEVSESSIFRFVTISSYYEHKNLTVLNKVIPILRDKKISCKFLLTISDNDFLRFEHNSDYITNLGPVNIADVPSLYESTNALFLPTLLECFSASYPEAMKSNRPILTSDMGFARTICGEAALYFDPMDAFDIVDKVIEIIRNPILRKKLVSKGLVRLEEFDSSNSRATKILTKCKELVNNQP